MNAIFVKIADRVGEIRAKYCFAQNLYHDLRTDEPSDFIITLTDKDIDFSDAESGQKTGLQIKTPNILRMFSEALLDFDTVLMHGAVIGVDDEAFMFTARSGTGKTTHIRKWLDNCPDAVVINGDKPFIKFNDDGTILACGSPWAGKENLYTNTMVPLKAIVLMERAEDNHIEQISFAQAFPILLQQTYRPDDVETMRKTLRLMQRLPQAVSFWRFRCNNFKEDCFDVAYKALMRNHL